MCIDLLTLALFKHCLNIVKLCYSPVLKLASNLKWIHCVYFLRLRAYGDWIGKNFFFLPVIPIYLIVKYSKQIARSTVYNKKNQKLDILTQYGVNSKYTLI